MKQTKSQTQKTTDIFGRVHLLSLFMAVCLFQTAAIRIANADEWFHVTASGEFIPKADIGSRNASFSSRQATIELSALVLEATYTLTGFSWNGAGALPFGTGDKAPWDQLHEVSGQAMYGGAINEKWSYFALGKGSAAFEKAFDQSYFEGVLVSGTQYAVSESFNLLVGGGFKYDDFEKRPFPFGGFQWDTGRGVSFSIMFPLETKISYSSPNERFSTSIDAFPETSAELVYHIVPPFEVGLRYVLSKDTMHRLSDESQVAPDHTKKYLRTDAQLASVGLTYSPFKRLTCEFDAAYYFSRELSVLNRDENTLHKLKPVDSFGGSFTLTYSL